MNPPPPPPLPILGDFPKIEKPESRANLGDRRVVAVTSLNVLDSSELYDAFGYRNGILGH
jgi:hypothetical protein